MYENTVDDKVLSQLIEANERIDALDGDTSKVFEVLQSLERELLLNKSMDLPQDQALLERLSEQDRQFVEEIDKEYYTRVRSSDTYYRRKNLIL